jgi:hypothetical protein
LITTFIITIIITRFDQHNHEVWVQTIQHIKSSRAVDSGDFDARTLQHPCHVIRVAGMGQVKREQACMDLGPISASRHGNRRDHHEVKM